MKNSFRRVLFPSGFDPRLLLLCICCVIGFLLGWLADRTVTESVHQALAEYLKQYAVSSAEMSLRASLASVSVAYLRYPVVLFLLGLTAVGTYLIPVVCMMQSFILSFAVCSFASALGRSGVALAFSAFGIRCLITLPCIFMMALWAMDFSREIRQQRGRVSMGNRNLSLYCARFAFCLLILLLGIAADLAVVPRLMKIVVHKFL